MQIKTKRILIRLMDAGVKLAILKWVDAFADSVAVALLVALTHDAFTYAQLLFEAAVK